MTILEYFAKHHKACEEEDPIAHKRMGILADRAKSVPYMAAFCCFDAATGGTNYGDNLLANAYHLGMTGAATEGRSKGTLLTGHLPRNYPVDVDPLLLSFHTCCTIE